MLFFFFIIFFLLYNYQPTLPKYNLLKIGNKNGIWTETNPIVRNSIKNKEPSGSLLISILQCIIINYMALEQQA